MERASEIIRRLDSIRGRAVGAGADELAQEMHEISGWVDEAGRHLDAYHRALLEAISRCRSGSRRAAIGQLVAQMPPLPPAE